MKTMWSASSVDTGSATGTATEGAKGGASASAALARHIGHKTPGSTGLLLSTAGLKA